MLQKLDPKKATSPVDFRDFGRFLTGLPCRSELLPPELRNLEGVSQRPSEKMQGMCDIVCPTEPDFKVYTNHFGEVVEVVDVASGMRSLREGKPTQAPRPKQYILVKDIGKPLIMICKQ
jgi:hypothetical protein